MFLVHVPKRISFYGHVSLETAISSKFGNNFIDTFFRNIYLFQVVIIRCYSFEIV